MKLSRIAFVVLLAFGMTLAFTLTARAFEIQNDLTVAPANQPHWVEFETSGLATGVPITIIGSRVNNGGNTTPFTVNFNSPGPSNSITTQPGSDIIYFDGFQNQYIINSTVYSLTNISPTSPFTTGLSGDTTTVLATYTSCSKLAITNQPVSTTVMVGASATFSVTVANASSASYQWYKGGLAINGATGSQYTINSAVVGDSGSYYVVVSSLCETLQSNSADLTVTKSPQTIDFTQPPSPAVYNTSFTVSPTATSGLPVAVQASGGCTINVDQVTMTSGSQGCTLTASQAGDANYLPAADVQWVVPAARAAQTIDFPPPPSTAVEGSSFTVNPTADSGLPVSLSASGSCTASGYLVTITQPSGTCTLTASQVGNGNYDPAEPVVHTVQANPFVYYLYFPVVH
ncbi:MAG: immunoglobulin domain-containing protein [Anaerolineales bacterium]